MRTSVRVAETALHTCRGEPGVPRTSKIPKKSPLLLDWETNWSNRAPAPRTEPFSPFLLLPEKRADRLFPAKADAWHKLTETDRREGKKIVWNLDCEKKGI